MCLALVLKLRGSKLLTLQDKVLLLPPVLQRLHVLLQHHLWSQCLGLHLMQRVLRRWCCQLLLLSLQLHSHAHGPGAQQQEEQQRERTVPLWLR